MPSSKFYDEEPMKEIRKTLEKEVLAWPGVTSRVMMGVLCYFYGRKFFAFLMPKNIVITKLPENEKKELAVRGGITAFEMFGKPVRSKTWVKVPLEDRSRVKMILPYLKKSYDASKST